MDKLTACKDCKFFMNTSTDPFDKTWYNCYCKASPKPMEFDPITGRMVRPKPEFKFCRDVNRGNCPLFERKP